MRALCSLTQPGVGWEVNACSLKVFSKHATECLSQLAPTNCTWGRLGSTFATFANKASWLGLSGLKVAANSVTLHS